LDLCIRYSGQWRGEVQAGVALRVALLDWLLYVARPARNGATRPAHFLARLAVLAARGSKRQQGCSDRPGLAPVTQETGSA